jgi:ribosome-associated protein
MTQSDPKPDSKIDQDNEENLPSKSQLKEEATRLQKLGKKLTTYSSEFLDKLSLPDRLISSIEEFNRLPNSHGARRRQLQFIGKLMRDLDYDQISTQIEKLENPRLTPTADQHPEPTTEKKEWEAWCDRILDLVDETINELVELNPEVERQFLRQIAREHKRADAKSKVRLRSKLSNYLQERIEPVS